MCDGVPPDYHKQAVEGASRDSPGEREPGVSEGLADDQEDN
jgi:hypothetical protein